MGKAIASEKLSDTLTLTECTDGYWLYDETRGMNLAMRAATREAALLSVIEYYQDRLTRVLSEHKSLAAKVDAFVDQFITDDNEEH